MEERLVAGEFTPKGHRTGSYWIDGSELMVGGDCDLCGDRHYAFLCPACGIEHETYQGDDEAGCDCGATLRISRTAQREFAEGFGC